MSHTTTVIIRNSLLEIFDPNSTEYAGVRSHFSSAELSVIDALRALPSNHVFTLTEKLMVNSAVLKAILTGED